jgi:hypothetical protein
VPHDAPLARRRRDARLVARGGVMPDSNRIFLTVNGKRTSLARLIANPAAATDVRVENCPGLTALPELPAATYVRVENCPGLTALPELPAATYVWVENCPGLIVFNAGQDSRGYQFVAVRIRSKWRIIAGCRNFSVAAARKHWGRGGPSNRPDCLALVKKLAAEIGEAAR